jgi:hypothetical protein
MPMKYRRKMSIFRTFTRDILANTLKTVNKNIEGGGLYAFTIH